MSTILTLRLDAALQARFDALRELYFPPERNQIAAHVTLFHTLPEAAEIMADLTAVAADETAFTVRITGLRSLGKGVAYKLAAAELLVLHGRLARAFQAELSAQDRQRFQPHVVVQNKVTAEAAKALLAQLSGEFAEFSGRGVGLDLWSYLDGPWEHLETFWFREP